MYSKLSTVASALSLFALGLTAPTSQNPTILARSALSGQATTYTGNVQGGACSFSTYTLPAGIYGTALSDSNWDNSANCGACISITGPSGTPVTAMIVDECPGCGQNHLDLFPDTWTAVTGQSPGIASVQWDYIECPSAVSGPLQIHFKSGVTQYWFSAQVVNGIDRTESLEVSSDNGSTWKSTQRETYNFFQLSGGTGSGTVAIRVTSEGGSQVVLNNVQIGSDTSVSASQNYS